MVFVVITEAAQDFSFLQARGNLVAVANLALGRKRAELEVWQRERGVLGSSAHPCLELDQPSPCVPLDGPITSLGARHRDRACWMCWHEGTVRDLLLIPYFCCSGYLSSYHRSLNRQTHVVCRALQNPAQSLQGPVRSISMNRVSVWRWRYRLTEHTTRAGGSVAAWAHLTPSSKQQQAGAGVWHLCKV